MAVSRRSRPWTLYTSNNSVVESESPKSKRGTCFHASGLSSRNDDDDDDEGNHGDDDDNAYEDDKDDADDDGDEDDNGD